MKVLQSAVAQQHGFDIFVSKALQFFKIVTLYVSIETKKNEYFKTSRNNRKKDTSHSP